MELTQKVISYQGYNVKVISSFFIWAVFCSIFKFLADTSLIVVPGI